MFDAGEIVDESSVLRVRDSFGAVNAIEMVRNGTGFRSDSWLTWMGYWSILKCIIV